MAAHFRFYGTVELNGEDFDVDVWYKTDAVDAEACSFTVADIQGLDEEEVELFDEFKKLSYNVLSFREFAEDNNLNLVAWVGQDESAVVLNNSTTTSTTTTTTTTGA